MSAEELESIGRMMAGTLRHFPEKFELKMEPNGFVDLREFIDALQRTRRRLQWLRPHHIVAIIETDPKGRYEYRDGKIRATYGHTLDLQLDLPTDGIPDQLYYPTTYPPEAGWIGKLDREAARANFAAMGAAHAADVSDQPRHPLMHRTQSLDFAIVLSGEIYLVLDDSETLLKAGDTVVQCGTNHAWSNRSDKPCRMAFVMLGAEPADGR